jgi:transcriptional regulator with XRE-family HTH domain
VNVTTIRERRDELGIPRATLALLVGVSERTIERWETGVTPHPRHQRKLAKRLGVDAGDLFPPKPEEVP